MDSSANEKMTTLKSAISTLMENKHFVYGKTPSTDHPSSSSSSSSHSSTSSTQRQIASGYDQDVNDDGDSPNLIISNDRDKKHGTDSPAHLTSSGSLISTTSSSNLLTSNSIKNVTGPSNHVKSTPPTSDQNIESYNYVTQVSPGILPAIDTNLARLSRSKSQSQDISAKFACKTEESTTNICNNIKGPGSTIKERLDALEKLVKSAPVMLGGHSIDCEMLIDLINAIYYECQNSELTRNKHQQRFLEIFDPLVQQINDLRLQSKDFDLIKVIGFGSFGQVSVVKSKCDGNFYAMKTLNKVSMLRRAEQACYREERDILLHGRSHNWFTRLHYAFQDETNLYLIMDYYPGGDLLTLISKYDDLLPEDMSRFYAAEIIKAISVLHDMGYIHRDIKPDNILLDKDGHARLADFGSCVKFSNVIWSGKCTIAVGTPDYISPDALKALEGGSKPGPLYDYDVDWWSLGVVIFESLFGETPFYAESLAETYSKVMNHETCFKIPESPKISGEAKDLISNLICSKPRRFKTFDQFRSHKWFDSIDWDNLRNTSPPYKPVISGPDDTSNFDIEEDSNSNALNQNKKYEVRNPKDKILDIHLPFVGFTATFSHSADSDVSVLRKNGDKMDGDQAMKQVDLVDGISVSERVLPNETSDLKASDIQQLESDLSVARQQWCELSALVGEVRKEKAALSIQLRSKETELEENLEKMSDLRKSLTNLEQIRRQQTDDISRLNLELDRERHKSFNMQREMSKLENRMQALMESQNDVDVIGQSINSESAKDELINHQKDYIAHMEEQLLKLQQQQPNWDTQVASLRNLDPENIYINSYQVEGSRIENSVASTTWQVRRSAKAERHEFNELQLSLQTELEEKRRIQNDLEDKKRELCQALADLAEVKIELTCLKNEFSKRDIVQAPGQSAPNRPLPVISQSMLFNGGRNSLASEADLRASLRQNTGLISQNTSNYQLASNLSNQSTYFSSGTEEGYSEADSAYRRIKTQQQQQMQQQQFIDPPNATFFKGQSQNTTISLDSAYNTKADKSRIYVNHDSIEKQSEKSSSYNRHMFLVRTFIMPLKCNLCTSLMIGLIRQGLVCESCGFACHALCAKAAANMACPYDDKKMIGLDPQRGIGTAYSGYVRIPKPGGVRKGWMRTYVVVCDFKLFLYDINGEASGSSSSSVSLGGSSSGRDEATIGRNNSVSVSRVVDLRDENFSVTSVLENDVIHASRTDISCIFRLSSTMIGDERTAHTHRKTFYQLMLVDRESEKIKWIEALHELHRIVRRNNLPSRNTMAAYSIISTAHLSQLRVMSNIHCAALLEDGEKRLLIGADEGLICCYLDILAYHRLPKGKKVIQMDILLSEQLIVVMSGRQRHIKLIPVRALESDSVGWIKMPETKNATTFVVHKDLPGSYISVAVKKSLYIYEITRRQFRYAPWREIHSNAVIQSLNSCGSFVCVGTCSNYHVHNISSRDGPPLYLINNDCDDLTYITQNPFEPLGCCKVDSDKWLLLFENHGVYVDSSGFKTLDPDLQFVTKCNSIATLSIRSNGDALDKLVLLVFSTHHIDIYDSRNSEWLQTINLKNTKPLQDHADNTLLCITGAFDLPMLVEITTKSDPKNRLLAETVSLTQPFTLKSNLVQKLQKMGSIEGIEIQRKASRVHISEPSDFQHLSHLGPANQSCLIDLNNKSIYSNSHNNNNVTNHQAPGQQSMGSCDSFGGDTRRQSDAME